VTVLAVALLGFLLLVTAALGVVAAIVVAHRRAQAAADLAALAGAAAWQRAADACGEAGAVAAANHARLSSCQVAGQDVMVTVQVDGPHWLGQHGSLAAMARAGPQGSAG
jgi:secretion/DNA translocation related TadE-like protein